MGYTVRSGGQRMSGQYVEALVQKSNVVPDDVSSAFDSGNMLILICLI